MSIYDQIANLGSNFNPIGSFMQGQNISQQNALYRQQQDEYARQRAEAEAEQERKNNLMSLAQNYAGAQGDERVNYLNQIAAIDPKYASQLRDLNQPKVFNMTPGGTLVDASGKVLHQSGFKPYEGQVAAGDTGSLPATPNTPFYGFTDPKKADDLRKFYAQEGYKQLQGLTEDASTASSTISDIDRFLSLNKKNQTGAFTGGSLVGGTRAAFDPEFAEMQSIADKLTPRMRQGMPGAASDRDVAMFANATVGTSKPYEANQNIGAGLKVAEQNKVDRAMFMQSYYNKRGSLLGAEEAWQQYLEANPIFDPQAPEGEFRLNQSRKPWKQFFGLEKKPKKSASDLQGYREKPQPSKRLKYNPQTGEFE